MLPPRLLLTLFCIATSLHPKSASAETLAYIGNLTNRWPVQSPREIADIQTISVYDPIAVKFSTGNAQTILRFVTLEFFVLGNVATWESLDLQLRSAGPTPTIVSLGAPTLNNAPTQWPKESLPGSYTQFIDFHPAEPIYLPPLASFELVLSQKPGSAANCELLFSNSRAYTSQDSWIRGETTSFQPLPPGRFLKFAIHATGGSETQGEFRLTATPAVAVGLPTKDGYKYEIQHSSDLDQWQEAATNIIGTGTEHRLSFPVSTAGFFRALEIPLGLTNTIRNIDDFYFDTASFSGEGGMITVRGARVSSSDYTFNDYLICSFAFDPMRKSFQLETVQAYRNLGLLCGNFLMRDVPSPITATFNGEVFREDSSHFIRATNQPISLHLEAGQAFSMVTLRAQEDFHCELTDEHGTKLKNLIVNRDTQFFHGKLNIFVSGTYSLRFKSVSGAPLDLGFRFINLNRRPTQVLRDGDFISTSLRDYQGDYVKYSVPLKAGEILRTDSTDDPQVELLIYDARGRFLTGRSGTAGLIFLAETDGTYYLVLSHFDFDFHSYSSFVSISSQ